MSNDRDSREGSIEMELRRIFALANRVVTAGVGCRGVEIEIVEDGWLVSTINESGDRADDYSERAGTLHTALGRLEAMLRAKVKGRRAVLQEQLAQLQDDSE